MTNPAKGKLEGKVALVTAASQGIGLATAEALARDGASVVIMGPREDALLSARNQLRERIPGSYIEMYAGDATDENQIRAALDATYVIQNRLDIVASVVGPPHLQTSADA